MPILLLIDPPYHRRRGTKYLFKEETTPMRFPRAPRGFTLIELLICVAIIAILAAIAVPNFLAAQTRAKVSRVHADLRTIATGLESYRIDNNKYPPDFTDQQLGHNRYREMLQRIVHLSTPIAYLTSIPNCFWAEKVASGGARFTNGDPHDGASYRKGGIAGAEIVRPLPYDYAKFDPDGLFPDNPLAWLYVTKNPLATSWALNSPGPMNNVFDWLGRDGIRPYDPTNGTISQGQILRTSAGANDIPRIL